MSRFKAGDVIIAPMLGRRWVFIAELNGYSYALHENDGPGADATAFLGTLDDGWKLAPEPEPFFEEGERYISSATGKTIQVLSVVKAMNDLPVAMVENIHTGDTITIRSHHFKGWKKI